MTSGSMPLPLARLPAAAAAVLLCVLLAAVTAVSPLVGLAFAPLLAVAAVAASHRTVAASVGLVVLLTALTAASPAIGAACAPLLVVAAVAATHRSAAKRVAVGTCSCAAMVVLLLFVTVRPTTAALAAAAVVAAGLGGAMCRPRLPEASRALTTAGKALAAAVAVAAVAVAVSAWPATALLAALVTGTLVLAWQRPALGFAAAVLLYGFEGSAKLLLGLEDTPLPGGNRAAGAALLDLALFGSIALVVARDRFATPIAFWRAATRIERLALGVVGAWLALSVLQIAVGGSLTQGLHGFRLFQAYTLVAVATLVIFGRGRLRTEAVRAALAIGVVVSAYAALRVIVGPADAEREFATSVETVTLYGDAVRAVGSFSSAVGLSSFLTPLAVFSLVIGLLMPRVRLLAWLTAALALIGLVGSYSRTSLFGVALGLVVGVALAIALGQMAGRRKLVAAGLSVVLVAATYGGVVVASQASPELRERAQGMLNPFTDESVQLRYETWRKTVATVPDHPLGTGLGSVGAASAPTQRKIKTTDNSFIKVLVEQGIPGLALFAVGFGALVVLLGRALSRASATRRAVGLAALAGFVSFLGMSLVGETVEQPGKIVAWGLLGLAAAMGLRNAAAPDDGRGGEPA